MVSRKKNTINKKILLVLVIMFVFSILSGLVIYADDIVIPSIELKIGGDNENTATSIQLLLLLTVLSLVPSILIMTTSFTRFIIVFSFLRKAISLQSTPPNQVLVALALFMTFFVMSPVITEIAETAYQPFINQEISQEVALERASKPLKVFMLKQVRTDDLALFVNLADNAEVIDLVKEDSPDRVSQYSEIIPITTLIPAFLVSEIKTGFEIGFLLFIPFIVIDMVVASTLMSLGMMMLPPVMISLPFKILLFIMVDGWHLIVEKLILTISR